MRLPSTSVQLGTLNLSRQQLLIEIKERRQAIRHHRDQKMDDRCWLDDYTLYAFLDDSPEGPVKLPSFEEMLRKCREFYELRSAENPDRQFVDRNPYPELWDKDLIIVSVDQLLLKLLELQLAIRMHRGTSDRPRNIHDDRSLYLILPEAITADFRLPAREEFLGEAKAPHAGCPSFWRSHMGCKDKCDLHQWGPCNSG